MKKHNHIYIKKICDHGAREVWLVDGGMVRRDLNDDFVESGYHAWHKMIPQNEIWIEKDTNEDEWKYFLENIDVEEKGVEEGMTLEESSKKADAVEEKDRRRKSRIQKILTSREERKEALLKIHKRKLEKYSNENLDVWLVDGEIVRGIYGLEYGFGGHGFVYHFVPKNEVWIEEVLDPHERKIILLHELHERFLMSQHGKEYLPAHEGATIVEMHYRKNPEGLDERLKEECDKNNF
ncbi:MAG: hypothetical protein WC878_01965 [Candidatus Paceibacterota bacterium]|jgi:hypothetical protein